MNNDIAQLSIKCLLSPGDRYVIPMYQRNYAWEEGEITQLIQDVIDYLPCDQYYYIGTLVVFERKEKSSTSYETIDGQQRLTTLSLLASFLKNRGIGDLSWLTKPVIHFESRENSQSTFAAIFNNTFEYDPSEVLTKEQINTGILNGYRLIDKILPQKLREHRIDGGAFTNYLLEKVQIMRVKVPADTDLNHYFEIMNSRGEQLEKHEVLKARFTKVLNGTSKDSEREEGEYCLHRVWEACANMERYVQMGFSPAERNLLFGERDWGQFRTKQFKDIRSHLVSVRDDSKTAGASRSLVDVIKKAGSGISLPDKTETSPERFNTVINFPNFLLHVLRVFTGKDVSLDDKRLLATFDEYLLKHDVESEDERKQARVRVRRFIFSLLRCKYLFDQYVIKREFIKESDGWSLKRVKWSDGGSGSRSRSGKANYVNTFGDEVSEGVDNRRILMLLSAFHVSTPTMVYKHWLNAALFWLYKTDEVKPSEYLSYLESTATAFVFDRYLADNEGVDYYDIIYLNHGKCQSKRDDISEEVLEQRLSFGAIENNLVFNWLDYLLWRDETAEQVIKAYEFTFRSSVEHYYPQTPLPGHERLPHKVLNSFGNLCLISHSKNSRLSNFMPEAKKEYYHHNTIDSIKQYRMMKSKNWTADEIHKHYEKMKEVILDGLQSR
ncbi:MAG: DUF262 domain-containing protein [Acidithiobacillus ferrivorans]